MIGKSNPSSVCEMSSGKSASVPGVVRHRHRHNLRNRFELVRTLGQGTYGKVKLAIEKTSGNKYAIKTIRKNKINKQDDLLKIRREIEIMATLSHPHIITVHEVYENQEKIVLVMEYASGGELYDYIDDKSGLQDNEARKFFRQIVSAVSYLHKNGIVHRDLKLENIFIDGKGNAKIGDFGLANVYTGDAFLSTFCGSPLYASPEIVNGLPYNGPEVDCWSLGVLLYTMAYGAMPFGSQDFKKLRRQISEANYFEPAQPSESAGLIRHLLTVNPTKRATISEIVSHWWVNWGFNTNPIHEIAAGRPVDRKNLQKSLSLNSSSESEEDVADPDEQHASKEPLKGILKGTKEKSRPRKKKDPEPVFWSKSSERNRHGNEVIARANKTSTSKTSEVKAVISKVEIDSAGKQAGVPSSPKSPDSVFDSSKKPKKSILKKKHSSSSSGGVPDDINIADYFASESSVPSRRWSVHSSSSKGSAGGSVSEDNYHLSDIEDALHGGNPLAGRVSKSTSSSGHSLSRSPEKSLFLLRHGSDSSEVCTGSPSVVTPNMRRHSISAASTSSTPVRRKLKGILKRNGKFSSSSSSSSLTERDPTWRNSLGSQSSNSSGDLLDFSYDSTDSSRPSSFCLPFPDDDSDLLQLGGCLNDDLQQMNLLDEAYFDRGVHRKAMCANLFTDAQAQLA